jgi:hypothetical protein
MPEPVRLRRLDAERIIATADLLQIRICERFPLAGLTKVAQDFSQLSRDTRDSALKLEEPIVWLRIVIALAFVAGAATFAFVGTFISFEQSTERGLGFVEGVEAAINTIVLAAVGFYALVNMEERLKNRAALRGLHSLRSVIHIIDMHQLTKDPVVFSKSFRPTASSPSRTMSVSDMKRYLDYCSELLSLSGKLAALYAQSLNNAVVAEAVNDIENLSTNLSRKIWQKITLLDGAVSRRRND